MRASFEMAGFAIQPYGVASDVCVIHGCTITARAEHDSLRLARSIKRRYPQSFVIIAGCVAEIGGAAARRAAAADLAVGQADKFNLPARLARYGFPVPTLGPTVPPRFETTRALVKIQDGCEFGCAYCIVPAARGPCRSRPKEEIILEIKRLVDESGFREVVLSGANIGCYDDRGTSLVDLLEQVEKQTGVTRIRLSSIEPTTIERPLLDFMAGSPKLCRFLHLPLQSGCDAILARMGRRYTLRQYRDIIEYAVRKIDLIALGTDLIAGFPGEDAAAFKAGEDFVASLPFSLLHVFSYSPRPLTPAADLPGPVGDLDKQGRTARLIELGQRKRKEFAQRWIGREVQVLVETAGDSGPRSGWTGEYLPARIEGPPPPLNSLALLRPHKIEGELLIGTVLLQS